MVYFTWCHSSCIFGVRAVIDFVLGFRAVMGCIFGVRPVRIVYVVYGH